MRRRVYLACTGALLLGFGCTIDVEVGRDDPSSGIDDVVPGGTTTRTTTTTRAAGGAGGAAATSTTTGSASTTSGSSGSTTASSSGGGGEGGGWACAPSPLVGMHWTGYEWQVARVDPWTGQLTVLDVLPGAPGLAMGFSGYDPGAQRIYQFADYAPGLTKVVTIDGITGAVLDAVPYAGNDIYNPEVNAAGEIVVLHRVDVGFTETATLDPTTGAITTLAPIPDVGSYAQAFSAVDPATNRIYQFGVGFVATFDGDDGAQLGTAQLTYPGWAKPEVWNPVVTSSGEIVGLIFAPGQTHTARIDPVTGTLTALAPYAGTAGLGMRAYDPCTGRIYHFLEDQMFTVDGTTGQLLSTVKLSGRISHVEAVY